MNQIVSPVEVRTSTHKYILPRMSKNHRVQLGYNNSGGKNEKKNFNTEVCLYDNNRTRKQQHGTHHFSREALFFALQVTLKF